MKPLIYFSYGMTKTGSTLAYHLVSEALIWGGQNAPRPPDHLLGPNKRINFVQHISENQAEGLLDFAQTTGHPVVLKTHTRPNPIVVKMLQDGRAIAHACYRDPRDMALSMLDHGVRARANRKPAFAEIETMEDAKTSIRNQCDSLTAWLRLPNVMPLNYEEIAFDMYNTVVKIQSQLDLDGDPDDAVAAALDGRFTQKNKGLSKRHQKEMTKSDSQSFKEEFAPFFDLIHQRPVAPKAGEVTLPPPRELRININP